MITIEQDGIRVEADCQAEALKLLRKEQRKARKERDRLHALECQAEQLAKSRVFNVLTRIIDGTGFPRGYGINRTAPAVKAEAVSYGTYRLSVHDCEDGYHTARRDVYCYGVEAVLENGSGQPMIVWLFESVGEQSAPYAVAAIPEAVGLARLPMSIRPELFEKGE